MAPCTYAYKENFIEVKAQSVKILIKLPPSEDIGSIVESFNPAEEDLDNYLKHFFGSKYEEKSFPCKLAKQRLCNQITLFYDMLLDVEEFNKPAGDLACLIFDPVEKASKECPKTEEVKQRPAEIVETRKTLLPQDSAPLPCEQQQQSGNTQTKPVVRIANIPSEKPPAVKVTPTTPSKPSKRPMRKCREYALPYSFFEEFVEEPVREKKRYVETTYCLECDEFTMDSKCGSHKPEIVKIKDKEVEMGIADRAKLTCPKEVAVCRSGIKGAGLGVYTNCLIKKGTMFGPYEGVFRTDVDLSPESRDGDYAWDVGEGLFIDARNEKRSNWMRYVNNGDAHSRTNLRAVRINKEVFYVTWRDVKPGFELLIWYGDDYADLLGCFDDGEEGDPEEERLDAYKCFKCNVFYSCRPFMFKHYRNCRGKISHESERGAVVPWLYCLCPKHSKCKERDRMRYAIKIPARSARKLKEQKSSNAVKKVRIAVVKSVNEKNGRERKFVCSSCDAKFAVKSVLVSHERIHTGEKPYACSYCDAKFTRPTVLKTHERIHTGEKPYACSYCDAKFTKLTNLKRHERIHTGEKPYACSYCDAKFTNSSDLKTHERIHTGEKPYACSYCDAKFPQLPHLKRHERIHTGEKPYACSYCDAKFTDRSNLNNHERIHTGEKPYALQLL